MKFSKRGDKGETSLLGGQRVPKYDPRPETYGVLDEASSVMGVARAMTRSQKIKDILLAVQKDLLMMGAELSALPGDVQKLSKRIDESDVQRVEDLIDDLQKEVKLKNEFIYPGETVVSAQIDVARTVIRRAERNAAKMKDDGLVKNPEIHKYLNRLADMLFTLARYEEVKG
ncbi:MAG TPA: cob(I)yrinic acid a,c-diamide adenosyltransferase [Syntrophales bacterium]|jgi:cob(I)alamin adenosyltransferase|nr:cob(I)yrinic acid a,c-diamide adenosyltransferase [Syntrophales bacterium]HRT61177.1 cob(I)yrinic acid a,c-diamide adenosyltransferase [Syntrophales bacterium]